MIVLFRRKYGPPPGNPPPPWPPHPPEDMRPVQPPRRGRSDYRWVFFWLGVIVGILLTVMADKAFGQQYPPPAPKYYPKPDFGKPVVPLPPTAAELEKKGIGPHGIPLYIPPSPAGARALIESILDQAQTSEPTQTPNLPVPFRRDLSPGTQHRPYAIDGDTIVVEGQHIRLFGIDAPELNQTCDGVQVGRQARARLQQLIDNAKLACSVRSTDRYGRAIAVCTDLGRMLDIGQEMVREGYAFAYRRYSQAYVPDEHSGPVHAFHCQNPETWRRR